MAHIQRSFPVPLEQWVCIQVPVGHTGQCPNLLPGWRSNKGRFNNAPAYWTFLHGRQISISSLTQGKAEPTHTCCPHGPHHLSNSILSLAQAKPWSHPWHLSCHNSLPIPLQILSFLSIKCIQNPATYYNPYNYHPGPSHCLLSSLLLGPCFLHLISTQQPGRCCPNPPVGSQL